MLLVLGLLFLLLTHPQLPTSLDDCQVSSEMKIEPADARPGQTVNVFAQIDSDDEDCRAQARSEPFLIVGAARWELKGNHHGS